MANYWQKYKDVPYPSSGETIVQKIDGKQVIISRNTYLNKYGNPIYKAQLVGKDGYVKREVKGTGTLPNLLGQLLEDNNNAKF